jgi:hypothetical protein
MAELPDHRPLSARQGLPAVHLDGYLCGGFRHPGEVASRWCMPGPAARRVSGQSLVLCHGPSARGCWRPSRHAARRAGTPAFTAGQSIKVDRERGVGGAPADPVPGTTGVGRVTQESLGGLRAGAPGDGVATARNAVGSRRTSSAMGWTRSRRLIATPYLVRTRESASSGASSRPSPTASPKPLTTFGTMNSDVLERMLPGYRRTNFCDLIAANPLGG